MSSSLFLIALAYFSEIQHQQLNNKNEKALRYWLYVANSRGRYSRGSSETILDVDLSTIVKGGTPFDLIESVRQQFGRLSFEPEEFVGRGAQSALFSLVYLALKERGAKDWQTGLGISLAHQGRLHYIQYHHIFPKARLKGVYETREIHEIANMAFISGKTNKRLSDKLPFDYLPKLDRQALESQGVPFDSQLHRLENYREFLNARRLILCELVNGFLDKAPSANDGIVKEHAVAAR